MATSQSENNQKGGISNAKYNKIYTLLKVLRNDQHDIDQEIKQMIEDTQRSAGNNETATWSEVFASKKAVVIGCGLMFFQVRWSSKSCFTRITLVLSSTYLYLFRL